MDIERAEFEDQLLEKGFQDQLHTARMMGQEEECLNNIEKAMGHKYFKREPNKRGKGYRYYYSEEEYNVEHREVSKVTMSNVKRFLESHGVMVGNGSARVSVDKAPSGAIIVHPANGYSLSDLYRTLSSGPYTAHTSTWSKEGGMRSANPQENEILVIELKDMKTSNSSTKHKDATDHIMKEGDTYKIDVLDPDTEHKKFKKGDKIKFDGQIGTVGKNLGDNIHEVILDK